MQKWEYCVMATTSRGSHVIHYKADGSELQPIAPGYERGENDDTAAIARTVAALGLDGWEMVGVNNSMSTDGTAWTQALYFKRPLA